LRFVSRAAAFHKASQRLLPQRTPSTAFEGKEKGDCQDDQSFMF
jgi:hypothetical protein